MVLAENYSALRLTRTGDCLSDRRRRVSIVGKPPSVQRPQPPTAASAVAAISAKQPRPPTLAQRVERIDRHGDRDGAIATPAEDDDVEFRVVLFDHEIVAAQPARYPPPQGSRIGAVDLFIETDRRPVRHVERRIQRGKHACDRGPAGVETNCRRVTRGAYRGG